MNENCLKMWHQTFQQQLQRKKNRCQWTWIYRMIAVKPVRPHSNYKYSNFSNYLTGILVSFSSDSLVQVTWSRLFRRTCATVALLFMIFAWMFVRSFVHDSLGKHKCRKYACFAFCLARFFMPVPNHKSSNETTDIYTDS